MCQEDNNSVGELIIAIELNLDDLVSLERGVVVGQSMVDFLIKDIKKNGLKNPLEVVWKLNHNCNKLMIEKGNNRKVALKNLGYTKAPCLLKIKFYKSNICLLDNFKNIFKER